MLKNPTQLTGQIAHGTGINAHAPRSSYLGRLGTLYTPGESRVYEGLAALTTWALLLHGQLELLRAALLRDLALGLSCHENRHD